MGVGNPPFDSQAAEPAFAALLGVLFYGQWGAPKSQGDNLC